MQMLDLMEPVAMPEPGVQETGVLKKVREAMYAICSLHTVKFQEFVEKHKLMHGDSSLDSVDLVVREPPYNIQSGGEQSRFD